MGSQQWRNEAHVAAAQHFPPGSVLAKREPSLTFALL
jgi:hypothetical protein